VVSPLVASVLEVTPRAMPPSDHDPASLLELSPPPPWERFRELVAQWSWETGGWSNPHKRLRHPAYQAIVALGWPAVPCLLAELADEDPGLWGPALSEITGEQVVVAPDDAWSLAAVAQAWLALAKTRGWFRE
jgi:hypothetical protein